MQAQHRYDRAIHSSNSQSRRKDIEETLASLDWKDLRRFLDAAEAGSLRGAAASGGYAINTLRNSLARLEDQLAYPVMQRSHTGLQLTAQGRELFDLVCQMRAMSARGCKGEGQGGGQQASELRIAVTEGLGTFWLMPRLVDFQEANPGLRVHLNCRMDRANLRDHEADLAIQLHRPTEPEMICVRLGMLHLMPFASDFYVQKYGVPTSIDDWPNHRLVWQEADQVISEVLPLFIGTTDPRELISVRTNTSTSHFFAVIQGSGIGLLPTYARAVSKWVRPLDIELRLKREIFCVYHPSKRRSPTVRSALAWLHRVFDPIAFPWFADQFIHPLQLESRMDGDTVINLFGDRG